MAELGSEHDSRTVAPSVSLSGPASFCNMRREWPLLHRVSVGINELIHVNTGQCLARGDHSVCDFSLFYKVSAFQGNMSPQSAQGPSETVDQQQDGEPSWFYF